MNEEKEVLGHTTVYDEWIKTVPAIPEKVRPVPQVSNGVDLRYLFQHQFSFATMPVVLLEGKAYVMKTRSFPDIKELLEFGKKQYVIYQVWKQDPLIEGGDEYWIRSAENDIMTKVN